MFVYLFNNLNRKHGFRNDEKFGRVFEKIDNMCEERKFKKYVLSIYENILHHFCNIQKDKSHIGNQTQNNNLSHKMLSRIGFEPTILGIVGNDVARPLKKPQGQQCSLFCLIYIVSFHSIKNVRYILKQ